MHDQSTDPAAGMPASASGGPGARKDSRLLGGFNTRPFIYNEDIASSSTEEVLAQSNPLTNNVCSFVIPGQNSPGVFWDLSKTTLEIAFSDSNSVVAESFFCKYLTSCLFFDKLSLSLNGVEISDEASGNLDISDATKIMLGQTYCPYPYGGGYKQNAVTSVQTPANAALTITNSSFALPLNGLFECELADTIYQSGVGSIPAITEGQLINDGRSVGRYMKIVKRCQGGKGVYKLMPQHPLWNADNGVLLPAVFNTKLELSKSRGSNLFEYATTHAAGDVTAGFPAFSPTIESIRLFAKRIVTSEAGLRTYRSMLNSVGVLVCPVIRNVVTTHQLQTGATSISLSQQGRRPRAVVIWCIPSVNRQLAGTPPRLPPDTCPLQAARGDTNRTTQQSNQCACRFKSLRLRVGGTDFPQKYEITRDTRPEASGASGGSALRDYEMYKEMCRSYQHDPIAPVFQSASSFAAAGFQAHFINVTDSESGIFDMRQPGGEEITTIEVIGQMEAIPGQVTVAICSVFSTSVTMDPVRGTVQRGW